jgi:hypothetical protein
MHYHIVEGSRDYCPIYHIIGFDGLIRTHIFATYSLREAMRRCDLLNAAIKRLAPDRSRD